MRFLEPGTAGSHTDILPAIETPTLVTHGRDDRLVPYAAAELMASLLPNAARLALLAADLLTRADEVIDKLPNARRLSRCKGVSNWQRVLSAATDRSASASLIGHSGSSAFRLSTTTVSMSLTGSCFSSESAPRPFHHGIRGRGGTIFRAALPSDER